MMTDQRTRHKAKIAGFIDGRTLVLSRGAEEGVQVGSFYAILGYDLQAVALIRTTIVDEKLSQAEGVWHSLHCPMLKVGMEVVLWGRVTREESEIREGLKVAKITLVNVKKVLKEAGEALPWPEVMRNIQLVEQYRTLKWFLREDVGKLELEEEKGG